MKAKGRGLSGKLAQPTREELLAKEQKRARASRRMRVWFLASLLLVGALCVLKRAYEIQVKSPESYESRHYPREIELQARRGNIYDRRGAELAVSVELDTVFLDPLELRKNELDPEAVARKLAKVLSLDVDTLVRRVREQSQKRYVLLKRRITPGESAAVAQLGAELGFVGKGVGMEKEPRRFYPNLTTAAHVLGYTNEAGHGMEGLEREYEMRLRGATDKVSAIFDARGGVVFSEQLADGQSAQGHNLTLTLDREIQVIAERELMMGVRAAEAKAGHVVVSDPFTGEILALANYPTFNPNLPGSAEPSARRNRAVSDRFEPGSIVKTFTVAGALFEGAIGETQQIDCENGVMVVSGKPIHDTHRWDKLTPAGILMHSSNIGAAKIGAALGKEGLYKALRRFGFGARTEVDLPAETEGSLRSYKRWYEVDAATIAFGQGMSSTNLQLAAAMGAIANGGKLMKPYLVSAITDVEGKIVEQPAPSVKRQVLPAHVARLVGDMLTAVTGPEGTGSEAAMEGYLVAGKTGTAQKAAPRGGYADGAWTSTFVGFVPAQKPRLVISVVIDEPIIEHYGGTVAGPVFRRIATDSLRHLGVPPEASSDKLAEIAKQLREQRSAAAAASKPVVEAGERGAPKIDDETQVRVPDLKGYGGRAALVVLQRAGLSGSLVGTGSAIEQSPPAGAVVKKGASVQLTLRRPGLPGGTREAEKRKRPREDGASSEPLASISRQVVR